MLGGEAALGADEAGVEGAGESDIGGSLDQTTAVRKEGEGVGWATEAKEEVVETDSSVGAEAVAHGGEVDGAVVLVDLDGVAAAESDVRTTLSPEVREQAQGADRAGGVGSAGIDLATLVCPEVVREQGAAHQVRLVGQEFEGFAGLDGSGEVDSGGEDSDGVTGLYGAGGRFREDAGEAGGFLLHVGSCGLQVVSAGENVHGGRVGANGGSVDPGLGLLDGVVVDQVSGFEVVGGVQYQIDGDHVGWGEEFVDVGRY